MNIFGTITRRTMKQNRSRSIVTIIGVILSAAMIAAVTTFGVSVQRFLVDASIEQDGNWHMMMEYISPQLKEKIENDQRVEEAGIITCAGYAEGIGLRNKEYIPYFFVQNFSGKCMDMLSLDLIQGRLPENDSEIIIPEYLHANQESGQELQVGDTVTLELGDRKQGESSLGMNVPYLSRENPDMTEEELQDYGGEETLVIRQQKTYTVVGVYDRLPWSYLSAGPAYEFIAGEDSRDISHQDDSCYWMIVRLKSVWDEKQFCEEIHADAPEGMVMNENRTLLRWYGVDNNQNYMKVFVRLLGIVIVLIMIASVSLIYNAFSISMRERTGQFGLLSSMGATKKQLKRALRYEAWTVCAVGIPLGIVSGVAGIGITLHFIGPLLADWIFGMDRGVDLQVSWIALVTAAILAIVTVQISVWLPARRLKNISPLEAIRSSEDIRIPSGKVKKKGLAGKFFGLEGMLASKNYRRDKRKYRATVVSLTLSIVVFVTAGAYVLYIDKGTKEAILSTQVDISVEAGSDEYSDYEKIEAVLEQTEGVDQISKYKRGFFYFRFPEDKVNEEVRSYFESGDEEDGTIVMNCFLTILPDEQFREYALSVGEDPEKYIGQDVLRAIYKNSYRTIDAETQRYCTVPILHMGEGEQLTLGNFEAAQEDGEVFCEEMEKTFSIVLEKETDVYPESSVQSYFSCNVSLFVPESMLEKIKDHVNTDRIYQYYSLKAKEHQKIYQELERERKNTESPLYSCNVYDMRESYEKNRSIGIVLQVLTDGFVILMSLIGVANVFNTVSTNLYLRRREFAMLRSIGMTQRGFRKMMGCECLIYGLRSIVYGIILSAGTSWLVYHSLRAGVDITYEVPWMYWGISVITVLLVVGITMVYTMRRMEKDNVIEVLKKE